MELRDFMIAIKSKTYAALRVLINLTDDYAQSWYRHLLAPSHPRLRRCRLSWSHCYNSHSRI